MNSPKLVATGCLVTLTVAALTYIYWLHRKRSRSQANMKVIVPRLRNQDEVKDMKWEHVGRVAKLYIYPVKSFAPVNVKTAQTGQCGLVSGSLRDRSFMVVSDKGKMITGRQIPRLVLVRPAVDGNTLTLSYFNKVDLTVDLSQVEDTNTRVTTEVWNDRVVGLDCGDECASWLEGIIERKCRLIYHASLPATRSTDIPAGYKYPLLRHDDQSLYADLNSYMLMTDESIADLQTRVPGCKLHPVNFRPNILVEGTPSAFHEDMWKYIKIGDAVFRNVKPCSRCIFTTIDSRTGKKDPNMEPLRTLRKYRCLDKDEPTTPHFGINLGLDLPGLLREGG